MLGDIKARLNSWPPWLNSLRGRLILFLLLTMLPVYSITFYAVLNARKQAAENARDDARTLANQVALKQNDIIEFGLQQLRLFAQLPIVRFPGMRSQCNNTFTKLLKLNPLYSNLGVIDRDGTLRCSAIKNGSHGNFSGEKFFRAALATRTFGASDYHFDETTGKNVITLANPVLDDLGQAQAVAFITLDLAALTNSLVKNITLPPGSSLFIVDNNGTIITRYPDPAFWIGKTHPSAPLLQAQFKRNKNATTEISGIDGIQRLYALQPLYLSANPQLYVSAGIPTALVYAGANALLYHALWLMALATVIVIALAILGGRALLLRPVNMLIDAAREFGSGNLSVRTGLPHTPDEFGALARVFDEMAQSIENRAQQQRANEIRYANIVKLAGDAIISIDSEQRIVAYNHTAVQIFGHPASAVLGQPLDMLLPAGIAVAHRKHIQNFGREPGTTRVMGAGREISGQRADGTVFSAEASISKFSENGRTMFTVVLRDITQRKQAEMLLQQKEALLTMVGTMAKVGGWEFDPITLQGSWTDEVARIHDTDPTDHTSVATGIQYYCAESKELIQAAVRDAIELGKSYDLELEMNTAKGNHKWVRTIGQAIRQNGKIVKIWGSFQDITQQKHAEEEIRQLNINLERRIGERTSELAAANKELEAFSYSVSHDLRTPLRAIDGFSQALVEDYAEQLDAQAKDYLSRVRNAAQRMSQLIDDMLTLSRITRAEMERKDVDLSELAAEVLAELRESEPQRKIEIHIEPGLCTVGDRQLLRVALANLLGNAWKYTAYQPHPQVEFGAMQSSSGITEFFVRDNGAGYNMAYADKLFGAFQRLHQESEFPGTGVGLATAQRIIHRHGGQIRGVGVPDQGATFYFTLPRKD